MDKILTITMNFLCKNREINEEQAEIIRYGLEILLLKISFSAAILIMSIFLKSFWECLFFMVLFPALRSYAGGYHAETRLSCFVLSMLSVASALGLIKLAVRFGWVSAVLLLLTVAASFVIWRFSPLDTENKPLEDEEKIIFRRKSRIMLCAEIIVALVAFAFGAGEIYTAALLSIILSGILLFVQIIKKSREAF